MSIELSVTAKGQITLKRSVLQHMDIKPGEKVDVTLLPDGRVELRPAARKPDIARLRGILKRPGQAVASLEDDDGCHQRGGEAKGEGVGVVERHRSGSRSSGGPSPLTVARSCRTERCNHRAGKAAAAACSHSRPSRVDGVKRSVRPRISADKRGCVRQSEMVFDEVTQLPRRHDFSRTSRAHQRRQYRWARWRVDFMCLMATRRYGQIFPPSSN